MSLMFYIGGKSTQLDFLSLRARFGKVLVILISIVASNCAFSTKGRVISLDCCCLTSKSKVVKYLFAHKIG